MKVAVRIRGIYTTALTKLCCDHNFIIVDPSPAITERFELKETWQILPPGGVRVKDRPDKEGIILEGGAEQVGGLIDVLRANLPDMVVRKRKVVRSGNFSLADLFESTIVEIEFPFLSKEALDKIRSEIEPTAKYHHRFRTFASEIIDEAENDLGCFPEKRERIEADLISLIYQTYQPGEEVEIFHIKPEGKIITLTPGEVIRFDPETAGLLVKRAFSSGGGYDTLDVPKERGDYCLTEATQGSWRLKHSYYSKDHQLKGTLWNINTPIEFYPSRVRYVDLHLDVVELPGRPPSVVDQPELDRAVAEGYITADLAKRAVKETEEIIGGV